MSKTHKRVKNVILAALPDEEYDRIFPKLEKVTLPLGQVIYKSGDVIKDVYFPSSGLVSLVRHMKGNVTIEVGVIGNDGMVGIPILLGDNIAFEEAIVQMAGEGMRLSSRALKESLNNSERSLQHELLLYTRRLLKQVTQTAACNRLHTIEQRLSRWMLMCRDRMETDELPLTQEFISNMLGTRREGVSAAASILQRNDLISYSRGRINILDRKGLEEFSCECYRAIQEKPRTRSLRAKDRAS